MVTPGRPAPGRGGARGGSGRAWVPGSGAIRRPRDPWQSLGGWDRIGPNSPPHGPGDTKESLSRGARSESPPHLAVFDSLVHDRLPGTLSGDVVSGGQGTRFHSLLPQHVAPRGKPRAGEWVGSLGLGSCSSLSESLPWGLPYPKGEGLRAPGLTRLPGLFCPDGKRPYRFRRREGSCPRWRRQPVARKGS